MNLEQAVIGLIDRSRNGDQNAMAHLVEIKNNRNANPIAAKAHQFGVSYAKQNPPPSVRPAFGGYSPTSFGALKAAEKDGPEYGRTIVAFVLDMGPSRYDSRVAADVVANLRPIDQHALRLILSGTPPNVRSVFAFSYRDPLCGPKKASGQNLTPDEVKALQLGYIIGMAKRLQDVREDRAPVSALSPRIGWELGEGFVP